jgi:hypothetical protein
MVQGVVKQFEKPRGAAPLAVSANSGLQRGLRAEDADGLPDGGPLPFDEAPEEAYVSRNEVGDRKKTSPENAARSIVIKIILDKG